jgi:diguanylate cyclase (GGDEF)-like protein
MRRLGEEIATAREHRRALSVAMIDLDHFKRINDTFCHPVGDEVLRLFVSGICTNVREVDQLGRYGGEEFVLILPDTVGPQAFKQSTACVR